MRISDWSSDVCSSDLSEAQAEIDWLIRLIGAMRTARTELNVPPGAKLGVVVHGASDETRRRIDRQGAALARLGRVESLSFGDSVSGGAAQIVVAEATFILPLEGVIDIEDRKSTRLNSRH